jgi:hypothetical protein
MLKLTKVLGTASALATVALLASPAAAGSLTDVAISANTEYNAFDSDVSGTDTINNWLVGLTVAMPLSDIPNLNFQVAASYNHSWLSGFSQETWNFGGDAFWAGMDGRFGVDFNYLTATHFGHITNGGVLGEWYAGPVTVMAKGGWVSSGGSGFGGHGNYLGGAAEFYIMPDLGITGGVEWSQVITGFGCQTCGRTGVNNTVWQINGEWLVSEDFGASVYLGYAHNQVSSSGNDSDANIFRVGLRWYMGAGSLVDHHRNGTLNPWLPSVNTGF